MQRPAQELIRRLDQHGRVGRRDLKKAPVYIQHQDHIGHGREHRPQLSLGRRHRRLRLLARRDIRDDGQYRLGLVGLVIDHAGACQSMDPAAILVLNAILGDPGSIRQ